jgi:hypothetical protein
MRCSSPVLRLLLTILVLAAGLMAPRAARAADPIDPKAVPDPLKPWVTWALDGKDDRLCPSFLGHADLSRCAWPSSLDLSLDDHGGRFTQKWHMDAKKWAPLPGDEKRWPLEVKVDGASAVVVVQGGSPAVALAPGEHTVAGVFAWDAIPESLHVPQETGILALTLRGAPVANPSRDAQGTVWLQKTAKNEEGDALELVIHRKLQDGVPAILTTRIELRVAGKNREELLGKPLPSGFVPLSLDSPLPARLEPDGHLRVQVRPGVFVLELAARSGEAVTKLTRPEPDGPWRKGEEVWVFEANPDMRVVTVEGVPSIDPQQTTLPDDWKRLPAYPLKVGDSLSFEEKRRGDADPPPNQLALSRSLWLDFDGTGYTVSDSLTGALNRDSRLTMAPPTILGRVSIGGRDQFITKMDGSGNDASRAGVEIRQGDLSVSADSRIPGDPGDIPAVGWAHDFHQVTATLNLPPGWRLLHASGVDEVPGTWLRRWSLLEVFLTLILAIGIGRLYGVPWGAATLATLVLTLPEEGAPRWSWLFVLGVEALVRALPQGRAKRAFALVRVGAILLVAVLALPFAVDQVRTGLHPVLESSSSILDHGLDLPKAENTLDMLSRGGDGNVVGQPPAVAASAAPIPAEAPPAADDREGAKGYAKRAGGPPGTPSASGVAGRTENAAVYDPTAIVQTGPGLPRWRWTALDLKWSGPVASTQRLRLYLMPPSVNLILGLLRAALLFALVFRLFPRSDRLLPGRWVGRGVAVLLVFFAPAMARADVPDKELLEELSKRLVRTPDCSPTCASSGRMVLEARGGTLRARLEVDAAARTAVPLPGASGQWTAARVLLDGQPAKAMVRLDGTLWLEVGPGRSQIVVEGPMPEAETVQLALPLKPHRVEVQTSGWTVAGLHEDGLADDVLELTRVRTEMGTTGTTLQPGALPPFVRVERTVEVGLNWQISTRIVRVSPPGTAIVLDVPLLAGESVTTADVRVEGGKAKVNMGAKTTEVSWRSVLEERSPVKLSAPRSLSWFEVWRLDVSPVWHATLTGIPLVHSAKVGGVTVPEWRPWPGEEAQIALVRPQGVPGQTLTIDESNLEVRPGIRATDVTLTLDMRSSRGAEHTLTLPADAELESLSINGAAAPIRQDGRRVTVPLVPGAQRIVLTWRETPGIRAFFTTPEVDVGAPSVNLSTTVKVPGGRWVLWVGGPRVGPAVLFWGLLLVLLAVSLVLGQSPWTPMKGWHWFLLVIGLSQVSVIAGAVFVGWLFALGWRARQKTEDLSPTVFNLRQALIAAWTLVALVILGVSLYQGLLGVPEMQLAGNGSSAESLRWFSDRSGAILPEARLLSVPLMVYRGAMLAWALWIALALLGWLKWGWGAFSAGGTWKRSPPRRFPQGPQPGPPVDPPTAGGPPPSEVPEPTP